MKYVVCNFSDLDPETIKELKKCCFKSGTMIKILNNPPINNKLKVALARTNKKIIGWSIFNDQMEYNLNLQVYVKRSYRGRGIGSRLVGLAEEHSNVERISVGCSTNKTLRFYKNNLKDADFLGMRNLNEVKWVSHDRANGMLEFY
jgi:GNAT superfamily N-acetyltransferase